mmetsp:Transcript_21353/g.33034  ORF Transcript_21353/g.33034 Transcript_21353/m.33034 type:complete len:153 (+) Transcript_21353:1456-1914(+)
MPLLADEKDGGKEDAYEFDEGQLSVSKMLHQVHNVNPDVWYSLLLKFKKVFMKGGVKRQKYTLPALFFSLLKLSALLESGGEHPSEEEGLVKADQMKIFKTLNEVVLTLQEQQPELAMKLYLQACQAINRLQNFHHLEEMAYEFASQAMLVY